MPVFRCQNESCLEDGRPHDFVATAPVCDRCQRDGRLPEHKAVVHKIEVLHLHAPHASGPDVGRGSRYAVACDGKSMFGRLATGDPRAVTCPVCITSEAYRKLVADLERTEDETHYPQGKSLAELRKCGCKGEGQIADPQK